MSKGEEFFTSIVRKSAYALLSSCLLGTVVYAGYQVTTEKKHQFNDEIDEILQSLKISDENFENLLKIFDETPMKNLPSFIKKLPLGDEVRRVLALDLGGTHFRLLLVDLLGSKKLNVVSKRFVVPQSLMTSNGKNLFQHLAQSLADFLEFENLFNDGNVYPLGFTFSFPCEQKSLASGRLISWTKGFTCDGVVDEDVVQLLQNAFDEKNLNVKCVALINDAVGTLMSSAYKIPSTRIGLILGTGTNASFMDDEQIFNTEWGAFGENHQIDFLRTKFDEEIDQTSKNPGKQIFEKMVSGFYLGELIRSILLDLIRRKLIFKEKTLIEIRRNFSTKFLSAIENDENAERILEDLVGEKPNDDDRRVFQEISREVSSRAAQLVAAGLIVLVNRLEKPFLTIGVDGSLYRNHPKFEEIIRKTMTKFVKKNFQFDLILSDDGSGLGAAIVAACVSQTKSLLINE